MATTVSLKERFAALQARAAAAVTAAGEKTKAEQRVKAEKRVERAAEKRLKKHVQSQFKRLDPADRELLLAEFGGDEKAAEKAAAEMLKGMDANRQWHLKWAGWNVSIGLRLKRLLELAALRGDAEGALKSYEQLPAGVEKDGLVADATEMLSAIDAEKSNLETDSMLRFFAWEANLVSLEDPGEKRIVQEIEAGLKGNYLRELPTEEAEEIRAAGKKAKAEGREEKHTPFIRVMRHPLPKPDNRDSLVNFRCITYVEDDDRERQSRNRLVFYGLNGLWSGYLAGKKEDRKAYTEFRKGCMELGDLASGKAGVGIGDISPDDPWILKRRDPETKQLVPMTHRETGEIVKDWGPVIMVVRDTKSGQVLYFPVLNREVEVPGLPKAYVASGMFMPLLKAGAWEEGPDGVLRPVEFRFEAGKAFASLRPASRDIWLDPWQLKTLKAIARFAGNLEAPPRDDDREGGTPEVPETPVTSPAQLPVEPRTERGSRSDGSKAGEGRRNRGKPKGGKPAVDDEVPDLSRVRTLADGRAAVGEE
jgi:hypothetical protein